MIYSVNNFICFKQESRIIILMSFIILSRALNSYSIMPRCAYLTHVSYPLMMGCSMFSQSFISCAEPYHLPRWDGQNKRSATRRTSWVDLMKHLREKVIDLLWFCICLAFDSSLFGQTRRNVNFFRNMQHRERLTSSSSAESFVIQQLNLD